MKTLLCYKIWDFTCKFIINKLNLPMVHFTLKKQRYTWKYLLKKKGKKEYTGKYIKVFQFQSYNNKLQKKIL
jgi:hypothetical protein